MGEDCEKPPIGGPEIHLKRVYEPAQESDGFRVLTERLWPRGLSKQRAAVDQWVKELAPSHQLRKWYNHQDHLWPEFKAAYRQELADNEAFEPWVEELRHRPVVTLVFASKGEQISTVVLARMVRERLGLPVADQN